MKQMLPTVEEIARNHGIAAERERCAALVEKSAELCLQNADARSIDMMRSVARVLQTVAHAIRRGDAAAR